MNNQISNSTKQEKQATNPFSEFRSSLHRARRYYDTCTRGQQQLNPYTVIETLLGMTEHEMVVLNDLLHGLRQTKVGNQPFADGAHQGLSVLAAAFGDLAKAAIRGDTDEYPYDRVYYPAIDLLTATWRFATGDWLEPTNSGDRQC